MYKLEELQSPDSLVNTNSAQINGRWVPCRSENYKFRSLKTRIKEAWAVFSGKADAFTWPEGQ